MRWMISPERFLTSTLRQSPHGASVTRILSAALEAVEPGAAVRRFIQRENDILRIANISYSLSDFKRILVVGIGKASLTMAVELAGILGEQLTGGVVVTKHAAGRTVELLTVMEGGHPVPDERSLAAGEKITETLTDLSADDLVFCLISGGGSALVAAPVEGVTLPDLQALTAALLACGAGIDEINTLRRHLDTLKGGGLARLASPAHVVSLILSDVVGNPLEAIASGPTTPDHTTCQDALAVIQKYRLRRKIPKSILTALASGRETLKAGDPVFTNVQNVLVGSNLSAAQAALKQAEAEGFHPYLLHTDLQGEASQAAVELCRTLRRAWQTGDPVPRPACIVAGGETTVTLCPHPGRGGRNQELALAAVTELAKFPEVMLVTLATDGEDGSTDAAGAVVTGETYARAQALGVDPAEHLRRNDAYPFFAALDDLLKPGPTGTNVNDLTFMFTLPRS
jgi:glycerate 2-kinase